MQLIQPTLSIEIETHPNQYQYASEPRRRGTEISIEIETLDLELCTFAEDCSRGTEISIEGRLYSQIDF